MEEEFNSIENKNEWNHLFYVSIHAFMFTNFHPSVLITMDILLICHFFHPSHFPHGFNQLQLTQRIREEADKHEFSHSDAKKKENKVLNRYRDVVPCKFTITFRVLLYDT